MKNNVLYTHDDLDGVGCAILAKLAFKDEVDIVYCRDNKECTRSMLSLVPNHLFKACERIFVTDLSFDKNAFENKKIFSKIKLFDHHDTTIIDFEKEKYAYVKKDIDGIQTCGTQLFEQYLIKKGWIENRNFFVEQIRLYDTWEWTKHTSKLPYYLNILRYGLGITKFVDIFTERLKKKDVNELNIFNQYERDIITFKIKENEKNIESYLSNVRIVNTKHGKFGFVFIGNECDVSNLGHAMCDKYDIDIAVMAKPNSGKMSFRTNRTDINVGILLRDIFGKSAGGHASSAGAKVNDDIVQNMILSMMKQFGDIEVLSM